MKFFKKLFSRWFHGSTQTPNEALNHLRQFKTSEFWVVNNSHSLGFGRAQLVFSYIPVGSITEVENPFPRNADWAHREGFANRQRDQLVLDLKAALRKGQQLVLKDTWLPIDALSYVSKECLFEMTDFWSAVVNGSVIVVSGSMAERMIMSKEAYPEIERLAHLESALKGNSHSIYTDAQLAEHPYVEPDDRTNQGVLVLKEKQILRTIINIDKFLKGDQ